MGDERNVVRDQGVLDLSRLTAPEDLAGIAAVEQVGVVVLPQSLAGAYAAIPASRVGATVYVPDGAPVRVHTGALTVGGDGLGGPDDVLVVVGLLVITSPVTGEVPRQITVVGSVLAPRGSESALGRAVTGSTGSVSYYPYAEGQDVRTLTGQLTLSGAGLANRGGEPDDLLIVAGQLVVTGPVDTLRYRYVYVNGQFAGPAASREVLEPAMQVQGQVGWYRSAEPRVLAGHTRLGPDYFRLLPGPVSLVVFGDVTVADGVTEEAVREKVSDIVLFGTVTAPPHVVSVLQVLANESFGTIRADDGSGS